MGEKRGYHRGRRKEKTKKNSIISTVVLLAAVAVFCVSGWQLYKIISGYQKGKSEYNDLKELALGSEKTGEDGEKVFSVNFEELLKLNSDTVGWIRFDPEPKQISYPVVQGPDNSLYLDKTFSKNDNTVGAIFVNVHNNKDFNDRHTIVYGHRMNDNSMFHDLEKFEDQSFWEKNQNFYIYTADGRKLTYQIYAAGPVSAVSDSYLTEFGSDEAYQSFLNLGKSEALYDTGIEVAASDTVVTLSTCVKGDDEQRFVVRGVKRNEEMTGGE